MHAYTYVHSCMYISMLCMGIAKIVVYFWFKQLAARVQFVKMGGNLAALGLVGLAAFGALRHERRQ